VLVLFVLGVRIIRHCISSSFMGTVLMFYPYSVVLMVYLNLRKKWNGSTRVKYQERCMLAVMMLMSLCFLGQQRFSNSMKKRYRFYFFNFVNVRCCRCFIFSSSNALVMQIENVGSVVNPSTTCHLLRNLILMMIYIGSLFCCQNREL